MVSSRLMPLLPPPADRPRVVFALALGLAGGGLATLVGLPLPWMLGPMLVCAAAALGGLPVVGPVAARPVVIPVIGVMLGAGFSPGILGELGGWAGTFVLLPPFLIAGGLSSWLWFRTVGGYDARTAFFCAAPGGLNEMIILGAEAGADERRIALAHALRIFVAITAVALGFALLGGTTTAGLDAAHTGFADLGPLDAVMLLACAVAGVPMARVLRLPAPALFGPMTLSAALHLTGLVTVPPPTVLVGVAQLVIGTVLGCRFVGASLRETGRDMLLGAGATLLLLMVTLVFASLVAALTPAPWSQVVLAYSPGGLAEMSLLALAKNQDVAYVATAHIARIVLILLAIQPLLRLLGERLPPPPPPRG
ncbi:AbrB family transcriptional regulator [Rhodovulum sp. 12E13]|uniref:AbrB family transcriptional regulator n=1 Tax=Rhodovulum sp. 12E13 TaxID=2203891 RepID=UPI001F236EEB|nr:AbrB family transcriptional regulator [Rhodovulum sp. 12E13]